MRSLSEIIRTILSAFKRKPKHYEIEQDVPNPEDLHGKVAMKVGPKPHKKLTHKERMKYHYI